MISALLSQEISQRVNPHRTPYDNMVYDDDDDDDTCGEKRDKMQNFFFYRTMANNINSNR